MGFWQISSRRLAVLASCGATLLLSGCGQFFPPNGSGGSGSSSSGSDYLYVGSLTSGNLSGFSLSNSALTSLSGSPFTAVVEPVALAITPNNEYLYAGSGANSQGVAVYPIESDGTLGSGSTVGQLYPSALQVDTSGNWLLGFDAETSPGEVYAFGISSNGGLTEPISSSIATLPNCSPSSDMAGLNPDLVIASSDNYVYASCGTAGIYVLSFSSGALTYVGQLSPKSTGAADSGLAIATTSSGSYLLAAETVTNGVRVFSINPSTGQFKEVSGSPFSAGSGPDAVLVDSTDSYVYVANRTDGTISEFTLDSSDGALAPISGASSISTGSSPVALVEDNSHTYVAAVCSGGSTGLETYTIGSGGALASFKTSTTGSAPASVAATH